MTRPAAAPGPRPGPAQDPAISPEAAEVLAERRAARLPFPINRLTVRAIRAGADRVFAPATKAARTEFYGVVSRTRIARTRVAKIALAPGEHGAAAEGDSDYLVYLHGGGWIVGRADDSIALQLVGATGLPMYSIDYPLAPKSPYPKALDACLDMWRELTEKNAGRPVLVGVSAGGNLALALLQRLRDEGLPLPAATVAMTPVTDLAESGGSTTDNEGVDPLLRWRGFMDKAIGAYAGKEDLADPLLSPVNADWSWLDRPTLITTGTRDLLRTDGLRLAAAMTNDGAPVSLDDRPGMWHAYQGIPWLPETRASLTDIAGFVAEALDAPAEAPGLGAGESGSMDAVTDQRSQPASASGGKASPASRAPDPDEPMLVVGLANPGPDYAETRHNIGFEVLCELADRVTPMPARLAAHKKTNCDLAEVTLAGRRVVLSRPRSYMNVSGGPVAAAAKYFSVAPENVIVMHDDLDLDFGRVRLKRGGGEGGHNGLRDITKALGTKDYLRVRAGIGRPPGRMNVASFVLKRFTKEEQKEVPLMIAEAADAAELLLRVDLETAQNQVHPRT